MEMFKINDLSFTYPERKNKALKNINLTINKGEFICICGRSGCGKTSLLRMLKTILTPHGILDGEVLLEGKKLNEYNSYEQAKKIGFVLQDADNQIVTDKVWHELSFGLENLGLSTQEIRTRVAEIASFFGIGQWFEKKVSVLSGGQKQILNLASAMVMQPSVLILDEPTSQLDPIAASEFLKTIKKINDELGTTIILSEHRLEDAMPLADRVLVMEDGEIIADEKPCNIGKILKDMNHDMFYALPTPMRAYESIESGGNSPITVRDGRVWLENIAKNKDVNLNFITEDKENISDDTSVELRDVYFRYEKELPDVVKAISLKVKKGEIFSIVGGNGSGKTTALSLIAGINTAYRGSVLINGNKIADIEELYNGILGVLPQNPQSLFMRKTVYLDLTDMLEDSDTTFNEKEVLIKEMADLCGISDLMDCHPYDLSGGEKQRVALCKVLIRNPQIVLLDEPTKGLDSHFKEIFAEILLKLKEKKKTVIMVSHDIEFCAKVSDRCGMLFNGTITSVSVPRKFFSGNSFYTTSANRMSRNIIDNVMLCDDIILACGGTLEKKVCDLKALPNVRKAELKEDTKEKTKDSFFKKYISGIIFLVIFVLFCIVQLSSNLGQNIIVQFITVISLGGFFSSFFPYKKEKIKPPLTRADRKLSKRRILASLLSLIAILLTIFIGIYALEDKKYYFISIMIILEILIPFVIMFEDSKPRSRKIVIVSVLCAIAVCGRTLFSALPQFKPVIAIIVICGVCFGGETGFLIGAVTGFVSNFFFGQGPWTPWQMFAFGTTGFFAGILFNNRFFKKNRLSLTIFGFLATVIIYGGIINPASILMMDPNPTIEMLLASYAMGLPYDLIHGASSAFFLWFISDTMLENLERIKQKYDF